MVVDNKQLNSTHNLVDNDTLILKAETYYADENRASADATTYNFTSEPSGYYLKANITNGTTKATNYNVTLVGSITINPRPIDPVDNHFVIDVAKSVEYNGQTNREPVVNTLTFDGISLERGTDYQLEVASGIKDVPADPINAPYAYAIKGIGNYTNTTSGCKGTWIITPHALNIDLGNLDGQVYDKTSYEYSTTLNSDNGLFDGDELDLALETYYDGKVCADAKTYVLPYTATGYKLKDTLSKRTTEPRNYKITFAGSATITPKPISDLESQITKEDPVYQAIALEPDVEIKDGEYTLIRDKDYTLQVVDGKKTNVPADGEQYYYVISGMENGNYFGTLEQRE